jgi:ATP-dependent DNA helicase RecQ
LLALTDGFPPEKLDVTMRTPARRGASQRRSGTENRARAGAPASGTTEVAASDNSVSRVPHSLDDIRAVVHKYWGFSALRPLQEEAIRAGLDGRDSLVVLPTGGGKSLCYQVPPLLADRVDIVVSPLSSLMKDQVDALTQCGYPAVAIHSGMTSEEKRDASRNLAQGEVRLAFVSPERLLNSSFLDVVRKADVRAFSIDEAHCISHWGHDFRPEYRGLRVLKERFPDASVHAYTATATARVRSDIIEQLGLEDPSVLVGRFDRPNLVYRVVPRHDLRAQVTGVLARHENQAVIVYCISRAETERLAAFLESRGHRAACYHAGLDAGDRVRIHEDFTAERLDVVVATVAFGMGIDRSNVRCVLHAAMPKSIEHYQQETGRAGRDGLEAECVLLFSTADLLRWRSLLEKRAAEGESMPDVLAASLELLDQMRRFGAPGRCRHRHLSEYFGQEYTEADCHACDVCLGETGALVEGTIPAQKILSCVARVGQRFGSTHVVDVLRGADTERIRELRHNELSTYGIMSDVPKPSITDMTYQLVDQELVERTSGEYPVLVLNDRSWEVLLGQREVFFLPTRSKAVKRTKAEIESWEDVDEGLFERLRSWRTGLARSRQVPPYVIFSDATLRDIVRRRPSTREGLLAVHGIGEKKLADYGEAVFEQIRGYEEQQARDPSEETIL